MAFHLRGRDPYPTHSQRISPKWNFTAPRGPVRAERARTVSVREDVSWACSLLWRCNPACQTVSALPDFLFSLRQEQVFHIDSKTESGKGRCSFNPQVNTVSVMLSRCLQFSDFCLCDCVKIGMGIIPGCLTSELMCINRITSYLFMLLMPVSRCHGKRPRRGLKLGG